jgi:lipopolysaccharide/colanic/teichoic acid biosynthesis glycosyltransferase
MAEAAETPRPATIAIAGASGFVGARLVPALLADGHGVLVLGRDAEVLARCFPGATAASYEDLPAALRGVGVLINLAVRNNDQGGSPAEFREANVELVKRLHAAAVAAGVKSLIQLSTFRADAPGGGDHYGMSKREAENWLEGRQGPAVTLVRAPAVHEGSFSGRLASLNRLPRALRPLGLVAALRPQVSMERLVDTLRDLVARPDNRPARVELADPKDDDRFYVFATRAIDVAFALVTIALFWWLLALVWLAIRLDSPGPGVFAQTRVGRHRRPFTCYKFRTMAVGTRHAATHETSQVAVTRVGAPLRRFKLDELPQVINLLRGEMSLVGPRPCLPVQVALIEERDRRGVYRAVPGITGWAQVRDIDMSDPVRLACADAAFMARRSLPLYFKILLMTFTGRGMADRVADRG